MPNERHASDKAPLYVKKSIIGKLPYAVNDESDDDETKNVSIIIDDDISPMKIRKNTPTAMMSSLPYQVSIILHFFK